MASQSAILQQCFQEAAAASKGALEHCVDHAVAILQEAEPKSMKMAERDELGTAWRELLKHKADWYAQYPRELLVAFKAAAAAAAREPSQLQPASASPKQRPDVLSLVDDTQLTEAIESSRLLQRIVPMVEQPLSELDALMSSVQGLPTVSPELNPLRPDVFAQTLRLLMTAARAEPASVSLWFKHMAEPLGRELKGIYEKQLQLLARAKVQAAGYRVLQSPSGASAPGKPSASGQGSGQGGGQGSGASGWGSVSGGLHPAGGPQSGHGGLPSHASEEQSMQYADLSGVEIGDALFQDFLFHGGANSHQKLAPSFYAAVEEELAALRDSPEEPEDEPPQEIPPPHYQAMPVVDRPQRFVDVLSQLSSKVWGAYSSAVGRSIVRTELKKDATQVGQVLGLEVVRKVVNQVAQDPRLLVPVREAIVALEPSLLRLAMVDPRFLSDERHPGRRLIEGVAQRSFKYNDEFSEEFGTFFEPVAESFNTLNKLTVENPQPFGDVLTELETSWTEQDQGEEGQREGLMQTLRVAEQRQAQADQIAYDFSLRSDLEQAPAVVLDFLFGPWALVMANARMKEPNQLDPGGFGAVVSDLLWSVKLGQTLNEPAKLIAMIPGLLGKLRTGLASLGQTPKESQAFFEALMKLHQPVLELRRLRSQRDASESAPMPLDIPLPDIPPATLEQRTPKASRQLWLGPKEQNAAGFEDIVPSDRGELTATPADSATVPLELPQSAEEAQQAEDDGSALSPAQILLGLREGSWVDLYSKERWLRAQLIWASTKGTLFMFVSHGGQPHSMTKRSCEKLIRDRFLRPVDMQDVVAHALDALAQEKAAASQPAALA
ncbi:MAG TPA: DUF1631 family protein [Burkholderiaceae bacterium]|nr:DUF1631 family protein [Burkholderiaceae bacterium]